MVCKNVHVARPSCSTSGGHPGGGDEFGPGRDPLVVLLFCPFAVFVAGNFQFRNEVHTLQGFPSGPITIPGGMPA